MAKIGHKGNGHAHITETPDVSHIKNVDVTHELSDVNVGGILKSVAGLTVLTVFAFVLIWGLFRLFNAREAKKEPPPGPLAMTEEERLPPEPKLQAARGFGVKLENGQWVNLEKREPQAEYHVLREQWDRQLKCDYKDEFVQARRIACMPIEAAIQKLIEDQGLQSRAQENSSGKQGDYLTGVPTAASSGRVTEKRKQ